MSSAPMRQVSRPGCGSASRRPVITPAAGISPARSARSRPALDAMIALRGAQVSTPAEIERVELAVHPFAVRITGLTNPETGLQSKFSIYHAAAAAYLDGCAGIAQFTDERATMADVVALRG